MAETAFDEYALALLNFSLRLIALEPDRQVLLERALETLSDFGRGRAVAAFLCSRDGEGLEPAGLFADGRFRALQPAVPIHDPALREILSRRQSAVLPARRGLAFPLPAPEDGGAESGESCLWLPLVSQGSEVHGLLSIAMPAPDFFSAGDLQTLHILSTLIALSLHNSRLFRMATRDSLTDLFSRSYFESRLQEELARIRRQGGRLALLMTDVDRFKAINDTHGHLRGDEILVALAGICRSVIRRDTDVACRYGGDEFLVLMPGMTTPQAVDFAKRLVSACRRRPFPAGEGLLAFTVSGGLVVADGAESLSGQELIRRADAMLYEAKARGRNRICLWPEAEDIGA